MEVVSGSAPDSLKRDPEKGLDRPAIKKARVMNGLPLK